MQYYKLTIMRYEVLFMCVICVNTLYIQRKDLVLMLCVMHYSKTLCSYLMTMHKSQFH